ncbi:DEAD/DEAH box helicase [Candidatus Parcubacteria bacterium]|nr:DEAD/DEAH box helicase [Candidatus Parcubacteria bacterium]
MYQKTFNNRSRGSFSRPKFNNHRTNRKPENRGSFIHPSKFVNKAVEIADEVAYASKHRFEDFAIAQALKNTIATKKYGAPTPIQDQAIPHILMGKDVVGIANTGTGKTAAFLIPLINKVLGDAKEQVLIIVPTRELAIQIDQELRDFTRGMRLFSVCAVGGTSIGPQLSALRHKNNFVIGTPGRLKDLIERKAMSLAAFQTVVLDEADRMLDMGFINDMRYVMKGMPANRHTLFFSATLSREIEGLISEFLKDPVRVSVKTGDTAKNVDQAVDKIAPGTQKVDVLHTLLAQKEEFNKVLVFGRTKHGVEKLSKMLVARGVASESIHGNKSHSQRQRALSKFKDNHVQVLVATDVAARGLDISQVSHVINYDLPMTYEDYVHRIGRTGRGGSRGKALTFIE